MCKTLSPFQLSLLNMQGAVACRLQAPALTTKTHVPFTCVAAPSVAVQRSAKTSKFSPQNSTFLTLLFSSEKTSPKASSDLVQRREIAAHLLQPLSGLLVVSAALCMPHCVCCCICHCLYTAACIPLPSILQLFRSAEHLQVPGRFQAHSPPVHWPVSA